MEFAYKRVSTAEQNLERQLAGKEFDREYIEKVSGKSLDRPQLQALLQNLREGDRVHVHELSRLGRSVKDLLEIVQRVLDAGASIRFHKEGLRFEGDQADPFQQLMLNLLSSIAQFERDLMLERQREGIAIAKAKGKYKGKQTRFSEAELKEIEEKFDTCSSKSQLAKEVGVSRQYLYKLIEKLKKGNPTYHRKS